MTTDRPRPDGVTQPLDRLAALVAALQDELEIQRRELDRLKAQSRQVAPPCSMCGRQIVGFVPPDDEIERDELRAAQVNPETGHRVHCGTRYTAAALAAAAL